MGRAPRQEDRGAVHHVIAKGSGGESIVRDATDRETLLGSLGAAVSRYRWVCLAYCLLDTHLHAIVVTPFANLGLGMQWFLARYARLFNSRHERQGNLFHTRFYSTRIASEEHLTSALVYVWLNPVRAGVVERAESWGGSSYGATIGATTASAFLDVGAVLELIDSQRESARLRLQRAVQETLERDRAHAGVRHRV